MNTIKREIDFQVKCILIVSTMIFGGFVVDAQTLQDVGNSIETSPQITIYTAKEIITMNPAQQRAEAVAVVNGKILAVGSLEELGK